MIDMNLYRYESRVTANGQMIYCDEFRVDRETPKGYWIEDETRWVSSYAKRRFAYPTRKEAWESFIARKNRQVKILQSQLNRAKALLDATEIHDVPEKCVEVSGIKIGLKMDGLGKRIENKTLASEWVFMVEVSGSPLHDNEEWVIVYVSPREYWEREGCIPDWECGEEFMPETWVECMDHSYVVRADIIYMNKEILLNFAREEFTEAGLMEVKWEDGEASRKRKYLEDLAEDGFTEDDDGNIIPIST
jgi:hypothetical protein